jgi:hypothetical protein
VRVKLGIGADDLVVLPQREVEALGLADGDEVDVRTARGAFCLVAHRAVPSQAHFAGSLSALSAPEVFHFVFTTLKSGVLLFSFGSQRRREAGVPARPEELRRKAVYFRDGQVVFASGSDRADRLGAVLWRNGVLSREDLERCGRLVSSARPLGQVLVDEGLLSSGQLYQGVTQQVREIVLAAFLETEGEFTFVEGPFDERNAVKLPERTRNLLLDGMRRLDVVERLAEVPDREAVVQLTGSVALDLDPKEARILEAVDGTRAVWQVIDESELFEGLKALASLVRLGAVEPVAPLAAAAAEREEEVVRTKTAPPPPPASGPFETYRRIFRRIFGEIRKVQPGARERLNSFFDRLPETQKPVFQGVRLDGEGEVDVAQVLLNVAAGGIYQGAAARARALEALESFLAFALFEVKNCLPRREAEALLREAGRMQVGEA